MRGPGVWNADLGLYRKIAITERLAAQFRVEAFNVANRPVTSGDLGGARFAAPP